MLKRAYSILHVKSVDGDKRIITGMATTPTPDRMGDVVEPLGVQFKNPLPLLLYHNSQKPVGTVKFSRPTADGVAFEARLPMVDEPGTVRDRIEEAWQSVKAGLLTAVSIGFRSIEESFNKETMGWHFLKTEVLELSLVAIPANQDATIASIKSLDIGLAALGETTESDHQRAGDSAVQSRASRRNRTMSKKTVSERIQALQTERKDIAEKMTKLMQPVVDESGDLSDDDQKEYDTLSANLKDVDADIVRFESLERAAVMPTAKSVDGGDADGASASRGRPRVVEVKSNLPEGIEFTRYVICKAAAKLLGESPLMVARERYPDNPRIQVMLKAAVAGGTTSDSTWAAPLASTAQTLTSEFLNYLRPRTIVGRFGTNGIPSLTRVPFNSRIQSQTSGGVAAWVGQGIQKPVTKFAFDAATLTWAKIAAISVLSDELIRFSTPSAETRVRDSLVNVIVERLDRDFIDPDKSASANVSPASITNGLAGLTPSTGGDATDVRTDVAAALGVFIDADQDPTDLVWIMSATSALQLSLMRNALGNREFPDITVNGGTFEGFPVIVSQYCAKVGSPTQNCVVLVKASEIFLADDGGVTVDLSTEASIEMSDDPANDSGTVVSMYQTNQVALRAERFINWSRGRTSSVAWLDGVAWSASA